MRQLFIRSRAELNAAIVEARARVGELRELERQHGALRAAREELVVRLDELRARLAPKHEAALEKAALEKAAANRPLRRGREADRSYLGSVLETVDIEESIADLGKGLETNAMRRDALRSSRRDLARLLEELRAQLQAAGTESTVSIARLSDEIGALEREREPTE